MKARVWTVIVRGLAVSLAGLVMCAGLARVGVARAEFGVKTFEAGTCRSDAPECNYGSPPEQFYTQAAGHPPLGITGFEVNTSLLGAPEGNIKDVRVDIPPGLSVNPQATPEMCTAAQLESNLCPADSLVGEDEVTASGLLPTTASLPMYNIEPPAGVPAEFGFTLNLGSIVNVHVFIVGGVSWHHEPETSENSGVPSGDYHEYFTIKEIPNSLPLVKSRLKFTGTAGDGTFLTLPSACTTQTSYLHADSYQDPGKFKAYETVSGEPPKAVSVSGCDVVPFKPQVVVRPASGQSDRTDAATIEVEVPQSTSAAEINSSTLQDTRLTLPEGMTLNPAVADGLQACTDAEFGQGTANPVLCPTESQIGTVAIETPSLPPGSLTGRVFVGQPLSDDPASGGEYRVFIDAESPRYGVAVRLLGSVSADPVTGQLTTAVLKAPPIPFSDFIVKLDGPHVPLANPLPCGPARAGALLTPSTAPYTGQPAASVLSSPFTVDADGKGGECPSPLPFMLTQSVSAQPTTGGSSSSFSLSLAREEGQQYLERVRTTLPAGLIARVPSVAVCGEPQAAAGECPAASQIGSASVAVGSGPSPLTLSGTVYFTGPYAGAPYGLLVTVPADKIGPYDYGRISTRAGISVDPYTARVSVSSALPTIVGGAPLRLRSLTVIANRPNFVLNPTNCGVLTTDTLLTSTLGSTALVSTPFQASGCDSLGFAPRFSASTSARTSRRNGASLTVTVRYPTGAQANIKSVVTQLPKLLPARLSTLNRACPAETFNANPAACPTDSAVGSAEASTPVLPGVLSGTAYFVSHGGASFPDLDIVLTGPNGIRVILVGNTNIASGITTSTFASIPDVPVSSFKLRLPTGRFSALTATADVCRGALVMPTTITAQNGKVLKQNTHISVSGCGVRILSRRVRHHRVILRLRVPSAGRLSVTGRGLRTVSGLRVRRAGNTTVSVRLSRAGLRALARMHRHHRHGHRLRSRLKVSFEPVRGSRSLAFTRASFR